MKRVFKYTINPPDESIDMPQGAKIISAGQQGCDIVIWAEVDPSNELGQRNVVAIPTGFAEIPDCYSFIATVQCYDAIVLHVYVENNYEN